LGAEKLDTQDIERDDDWHFQVVEAGELNIMEVQNSFAKAWSAGCKNPASGGEIDPDHKG
jgi:hypothetical protein